LNQVGERVRRWPLGACPSTGFPVRGSPPVWMYVLRMYVCTYVHTYIQTCMNGWEGLRGVAAEVEWDWGASRGADGRSHRMSCDQNAGRLFRGPSVWRFGQFRRVGGSVPPCCACECACGVWDATMQYCTGSDHDYELLITKYDARTAILPRAAVDGCNHAKLKPVPGAACWPRKRRCGGRAGERLRATGMTLRARNAGAST